MIELCVGFTRDECRHDTTIEFKMCAFGRGGGETDSRVRPAADGCDLSLFPLLICRRGMHTHTQKMERAEESIPI